MKLHRKSLIVVLALFTIGCASCSTQNELSENLVKMKTEVGDKADVYQNVEYANVDGQSMLLDLYIPKNAAEPVPVIVWIHGGGWYEGGKDWYAPTRFIDHGYAAVSISYRLTGVAPFPAQIYDCKGAIRWLRANAAKYNIDPDRIGVFGSSAGGHLAALLGTSGGVKELEGDVGGNLEYSSDVQAVCDSFGPINLIEIHRGLPEDAWRVDVLHKLLGGP
jgi:acetyl esterase/lipase